MLRILRAFAWLRWRILLNSLERRGSRDVLERFSIAFEQLAPTIVAIVMVPSLAVLAAAAGYAGWALGHGEPRVLAFELLRYLLFAASVLAVVGPMMLPGADRSHAVRLLLLPIPRAALYLAQSMSALADPWILFVAAIVIALPVGLATAGALPAAAVAAGAGLLLLAVLVGITLVVTSTVHLVVRDRRRGELFTLVIVVVLPLLGILPGLLGGERRERAPEQIVEPAREPQQERWWTGLERAALASVPSELYTRATRVAAGDPAGAAAPVMVLVAMTGLLHALGFAAFSRVLSSPGVIGSGRTASKRGSTKWRVPGASPGTSAVAINQLRLALRTPRGRSTILSPVLVFAMFAVMMIRGGNGMEFGPISLKSGVGLAAFASFVSLLSVLPLAMNQFAIDRSGLTLALLSPLTTVSLLRGKAIGNALVVAIPTSLCLGAALVLFPAGAPGLWLSVPLALISTYLVAAPAAALLSAVFPRAVDLNSIGRGSNAHGAAGLLGMLSFLAAGAPALLIVMVTGSLLKRPALAPVVLALWAAAALVLDVWLFRLAAIAFEKRKENLGLTARGQSS